MTDNQALGAAIVAAGLDPRNHAVREAWRAGIEKYIEVRNSEAVAWLTRMDEHQFITDWKPTAESWERDGWKIEPLFLAPSTGGETVKQLQLALEASQMLINRLMHVYVAPDECTSYVKASTQWFWDNGGTLAAIAEQNEINRSALVSHPPQSTPVDSQIMPDVKGKETDLEGAVRNMIANRSSHFKARNGRLVSIEDDSGEHSWIVSFDDMAEIESALTSSETDKEKGR